MEFRCGLIEVAICSEVDAGCWETRSRSISLNEVLRKLAEGSLGLDPVDVTGGFINGTILLEDFVPGPVIENPLPTYFQSRCPCEASVSQGQLLR
ncbi:hypothetical protein Mp_4g05050 [Marchantia polymorpha subsp. ruderalis]|uniref:Uncharacterized protein n=2 Tax=Marchantia polymorpha TaxID=3197 RepID=A0AAF6B6I2_MARPO|nr:hypothetical protein MARPO_0087s0084 [Marchantia polymorpha]BBN07616.1 hypothetical protein Mp_4g05050 [Marchantia polymorpha subsp. ruderalis]|eukprot:PTQ33656.1 hypothetical protein MARPO_0087s0084 [Marchantia polymorpha]